MNTLPPVKLDITINPHTTPDRVALLSRLTEDAGFDGVWCGTPPMSWESTLQLAVAAQNTKRINVGYALTNPYTRSPAKTILSVAHLDHITHGRLIFTWGAGDLDGIRSMGYDWNNPLTYMREAINVSRRLLAGEKLTFNGETMTLKDFHIDFPILRKSIPIFTGCRRKFMLQLTGQLADGVLIDYPPIARIPWCIEQLKIGAAKGNRKISNDNFSTGALLPFSVARESSVAKNRNRRLIPVTFVSISDEELQTVGLTREDIEPIKTAMSQHSSDAITEASKYVTDKMVDMFTIAGTPEECIETIEKYRKAGVTRFDFDIPYDPALYPEESIMLAKQKIIPYFKDQ